MRILPIFFVSFLVHCCVEGDLMDDLVEIIIRNPRGKELIRKAVDREKEEETLLGNKKDITPPTSFYWKRGIASNIIPSSTNNNQPFGANYQNAGWRGGKREEEDDIKSLLDRILIKDKQKDNVEESKPVKTEKVVTPTLPWSDELKDESTEGDKLYERLTSDLQDLVMIRNKAEGKKNSNQDKLSKLVK